MMRDYPDRMTPEQARQFCDDVLNIVSQIPCGCVTTYGVIAAWAGWPSHSRMVGRTLRYTPGAEQLPCHRVVNKERAYNPRMEPSAPFIGKRGRGFQAKRSCRHGSPSLATSDGGMSLSCHLEESLCQVAVAVRILVQIVLMILLSRVEIL